MAIPAQVFRIRPDMYLVGGAVRDAALGVQKKTTDYDFTCPPGALRSTAESIHAKLGGTLFQLHEQGMRISRRDCIVIDISEYDKTVMHDLGRRDYTINSLAWSPGAGLIDPNVGLADIQGGIIRMVSRKNIKEDPLRILRGYRFQAELGFKVEQETRSAFVALRARIGGSARERVSAEFVKLVNAPNAVAALTNALQDGVIAQIIPLNNSQILLLVKQLHKICRIIKKQPYRKHFKYGPMGLCGAGIAIFELVTLGVPLDDIKMTMSADLKRRLSRVWHAYNMIADGQDPFEVFEYARDVSLDAIALSRKETLIRDFQRYEGILRIPFVTGDDVMEIAGIPEGVKVRDALKTIRRMRFNGEIRSRSSVVRHLSSNLI